MKRIFCLICFLIFLVPFVAFSQKASQDNPRIYKINRYGGQSASLFLKTITINQNQTIVDFTAEGGGWAQLYKKDTPYAMFIKGKISGKRYELIDAIGISWYPEKTKFHGNLKFKVIFERIDDIDTEIDIIEGNEKFEDSSFTIRNIELK
jgi:hypothetical protein